MMDSSVHPPRVEEARLVGFSLDTVEVSMSPEFLELSSGHPLPEFRWLKITGDDRNADFWLTPDFRLEVSSRALEVLKKFKLAHAVIDVAES